MATAVLPLYLAALGLGPAALGIMAGLADFLVSLSKLGGDGVGHHVHRKPTPKQSSGSIPGAFRTSSRMTAETVRVTWSAFFLPGGFS